MFLWPVGDRFCVHLLWGFFSINMKYVLALKLCKETSCQCEKSSKPCIGKNCNRMTPETCMGDLARHVHVCVSVRNIYVRLCGHVAVNVFVGFNNCMHPSVA